jgi:hypothetical protein
MRRLFDLRAFSTLVIGLGLAACGEDAAKPSDDANADASGDGEVEVDPWLAPAETGAFRILYSNRGRLPDNASENELWLMDSDGSDELAITDLGGLEALDPPLSCNYGCIVSPDLKWIAVVAGPPSATGFELKLGKFDPNMKVSLLKGGAIKGVVDFKFAGDRMFYSKQKSCTGASCEYEFSLVELAENVNLPLPFLTFPQGEELADSTYKGHFRVSADAKHMVMLKTTIRSVGVWLWKDGTGLVELDYLCKFGTKGNCSGTGSEYTDVDPVAIDPTGRYIVFFSFADRWQRAHVYDTQNPGNIQTSIIAAVSSGAYIEKACDAGVLADWQWQRVIGEASFTPDGSEVIFLGENACPVGGQQPQKTRTNIYRLKLATLLSGKTLGESDIFNVTNHPFGDVTANRRPNAFALSPDGATVVFTGTPSYDQSGALIADGTARQRNDREVYRIRLDGSNAQQLTNDLPFSAESPMVVGP